MQLSPMQTSNDERFLSSFDMHAQFLSVSRMPERMRALSKTRVVNPSQKIHHYYRLFCCLTASSHRLATSRTF